LLSISSRDQIEEKRFQPEHLAQLEQVAAEIIAAQPPALQAQLLSGVANYMAHEKKIGMTAEQLTQHLIARVSESSKRHLQERNTQDWVARTDTGASLSPAASL
jgi:hypothetical protein